MRAEGFRATNAITGPDSRRSADCARALYGPA